MTGRPRPEHPARTRPTIAGRTATESVVLIGEEIGYSASPGMHNAAFAALGLPWRYDLRDIASAALPAVFAELRSGTLRGANITRPHKVRALELADGLAGSADRAGAVNTIVVADGRLTGHNTDVQAIAEEVALLAAEARGAVPGFVSAVVLGRGGAARAVAAVLSGSDTPVELVGRDQWAGLRSLLRSADLLVNATPVGTASDESPVEATFLRPDLVVLDLVYRPSPTRLVREARLVGARARGGAGVLLRQAALSFELWAARPAPLDAMRRALEAELGAAIDA